MAVDTFLTPLAKRNGRAPQRTKSEVQETPSAPNGDEHIHLSLRHEQQGFSVVDLQESRRARDLQSQLSGAKFDMCKPMIDALGAALVPGASDAADGSPLTLKVMTDFSTWITMFGSDGAVLAFRNFQQGSFKDAPSLSGLDLMGVRINGIYSSDQTRRALSEPWSALEISSPSPRDGQRQPRSGGPCSRWSRSFPS